MTGFGQELRLERERRGVSLDWLCAETKVNPRHFEALEHGDYRVLPGGVIRRGIVRAYVIALGLDEQVWMPRFHASYAEQAREQGEDPAKDQAAWIAFAENVKRGREKTGRRTGLRWVGVLALFLALLAVGWEVWWIVVRARLEG